MRGFGKIRLVYRRTREVRLVWMSSGCGPLEVEATGAEFDVSLLRQLVQFLRIYSLAPAHGRGGVHWFDCEQFSAIPVARSFGYGDYGSFYPSALLSRVRPPAHFELRSEKE